MSFDRAVEVFGRHLKAIGREEDPREAILEWIDLDEPNDDAFAQDVRIVLAAAEFSKELTTAVMWLNQHELDIRCVRIKPYKDGDRLLLDVQQVLPLPEAEDFQVQIREKQQRERAARQSSKDFTRYDVTVAGQSEKGLNKRNAIFFAVKGLCDLGVPPDEIRDTITYQKKRLFRSVDGEVGADEFVSRLVAEQKSGGDRFEPRRYYCKDTDLIVSGGRTYAFWNQWGRNIAYEAIQELSRRFPDRGISCTPST